RLDCDTSLIAFEGYLDLGAAPELKWVLVEEFGAGPRRLVLDLSRVTFMDSTALGVLVGIQRNLSQGAVLAIAAASPAVLRLFELTGVDRTFDLFATVGAAVASLQPKPPDFVDASREDAMPAAEPVRPRVKSLGDEPA